MKIILIAAIAPGGVIGRSKKPCEACAGTGLIYGSSLCPKSTCDGTGFVPCNELPWPPRTYPEDVDHFKKVTMGSAVVMGRLTKESIPSKFFPLEGRANFVVSGTLARYTRKIRPDEHYVSSFGVAREAAQMTGQSALYVIGGARLYAEALPVADELNLTLISRKWDGDVLFPGGNTICERTHTGDPQPGVHFFWPGGVKAYFECVSREPCPTNPDLTFTRWVRA